MKNRLVSTVTNITEFAKNDILQQNTPDFLREDLSARFSRFVRRPRNAIAVLLLLSVVVGGTVWYTLYSTTATIGAANQKELSSIRLSFSGFLVTADTTSGAYRNGVSNVTCDEARRDEWHDYKLSSLVERLYEAKHQLNATCACAPQTGIAARMMLVGETVMYNPVLGVLPWYYTVGKLETIVTEGSSLYPDRAPVEVVRYSRIRLVYQDQQCATHFTIFGGSDSICAQACLQLFDGKTVYDLQEKAK